MLQAYVAGAASRTQKGNLEAGAQIGIAAHAIVPLGEDLLGHARGARHCAAQELSVDEYPAQCALRHSTPFPSHADNCS
jgi:hypothetical protein